METFVLTNLSALCHLLRFTRRGWKQRRLATPKCFLAIWSIILFCGHFPHIVQKFSIYGYDTQYPWQSDISCPMDFPKDARWSHVWPKRTRINLFWTSFPVFFFALIFLCKNFHRLFNLDEQSIWIIHRNNRFLASALFGININTTAIDNEQMSTRSCVSIRGVS